MKIAVAKDGDIVAEHFGHCREYDIFTVEDGAVTERISVASPGHAPGVIPRFLKENGADVVLAGGMGQGAIEMFRQLGVEALIGVSGKIEDAVKDYIDGNLESGQNICNH